MTLTSLHADLSRIAYGCSGKVAYAPMDLVP